MSDTEKKIVRQVISDALAAGYIVSVNDGEETVLKNGTDAPSILAAMFSTEEDYLIFHTAQHSRVGWVRFIYGNESDVLSDHSDNEAMRALVAKANALSDSLS